AVGAVHNAASIGIFRDHYPPLIGIAGSGPTDDVGRGNGGDAEIFIGGLFPDVVSTALFGEWYGHCLPPCLSGPPTVYLYRRAAQYQIQPIRKGWPHLFPATGKEMEL